MACIFFSVFSVHAQRASTFGSPQTLNGAASYWVRIVELDDTHIIAIYKDGGSGASNDLYARMGEVNKTTQVISWGTARLIDASSNLSVGLVAISSTTAVVYYELTDDDQGVMRVLTLDPGTETISTIGATNVYAGGIDLAGNQIQQQAQKLTSTTFAIGYVDNGNSDRGTVKIGTVTGSAIAFGDPYIFSTNTDVNFPSMTALSSTKLAFSWEDDPNGDVGKVRVGEVSGTTVTFGDEVAFTTTAVGGTAIAAVSSTQFVVAYEDDASTSPADPGSAYVGSVNGTRIILSSSNFQFETSQDVLDLSIDGIYENEFIIGWNSGAGGNTRYIIGKVSGGNADASISYESQKTVLTALEGDISWVSRLDNNTAIMGYIDDEDASHVELVVINLTPDLVLPRFASQGNLDVFKDALTTQARSVRLGDDRVLITWLDGTGSTSNNLLAVVGTVSGTDITYGDIVTINSNVFISSMGLVAFSSTKAAIVYETNRDTDISVYNVLDIAGSTITVNTAGTFADGDQFGFNKSITALALNNQELVVTYEKDQTSDVFKIVAGTVSGSTITWGSTLSVTNDDISHVDLARLSDSRFALVYEDNQTSAANGDEGMVVIGSVLSNAINLGTPESFASTQDVITTRVAALSPTEIVIAYEYDADDDFGELRYATISGTDVTFSGNTVPFYVTEGIDDIEMDAISDTEFILVVDGGVGDASVFYTGLVTSGNITLTSPTDIYVGQADDISVSALTSDLVVLAFTNDNNAGGSTTDDRGDALILSLTATSNPEINVQGNVTSIESGDITSRTADHTDFGTGATLSRTFTIQNQGTGTLTLGVDAVSITGTNAADFSVGTQPGTTVSGNGSTTFIIDFASSVTSTRTAEIHITSDDIHEFDYIFSIEAVGGISAPSSVTVAATVFIEGAYNGTNLNTTLNASIPTTQPYSLNGHAGAETAGAVPAGAVDWVLVELREAASAAAALSATKVGSAAGFLMNDGTIKSTDGTSDLTISLSGNTGSDFFVVIYHRNHLAVMSANDISESGGTYSIDFTSSSSNTYQTTSALSTLATGKFAMPAGDADGDGDIDATDLTTWRGQNGGVFDYNTTNGDFNLDGVINAVDRIEFQKKNISKTTQVPNT